MNLDFPGLGGGGTKLPLYVGLGAIAIGFLLFRRSPTSQGGGGTPFNSAGAAEFARVVQESRSDMYALTATNDLKRYELDLNQANTPAGMRECWTGEQWRALPEGVRKSIKAQAARGGDRFTAGPNGGFCLTPTSRGQEGDLMSVQRSSGGLISTRSSGIGAPAPNRGRPGILDAWNSWLNANLKVLQIEAAGGGR